MSEDGLFKNFAESNPNGQVILDPDLNMVFVNTALCSLLGREQGDLLQQNVSFLEIHGLVRKIGMKTDPLQKAIREKTATFDRVIIQSPSGKCNIKRQIIPCFDQDKQLSSIMIQFLDVSELVRHIEDARLYHQMFEKSLVA